MSRIVGLIAVLIVLLVGALLAKRQISGMHAALGAASQASTLAMPDVRTPQDARRLTEQVQGEVNQMMEDHEKQLKQNMDSQTP
jgi:HAMP domain-containing protein